MAVVSVKEMWSSTPSSGDQQGRRATRAFQVLVDDPVNDTSVTAQHASGLPSDGDQHPNDTYLRVEGGSVDRINPLLYHVYVYYSMVGGAQINPHDYKPKPQWSTVIMQGKQDTTFLPVYMERNGQRTLWREANPYGTPLANAVGEGFTPQLQEDEVIELLTLTRFEPDYNPFWNREWAKRVNLLPFYGFPPGEGRMLPRHGAPQQRGSHLLWEVTYRVMFREYGWFRRLPHRGFRYKTGEAGEAVRELYVKEDGSRAASAQEGKRPRDPAPLNPDGTLVNANSPFDVQDSQLYWIVFERYPYKDYAPLALE